MYIKVCSSLSHFFTFHLVILCIWLLEGMVLNIFHHQHDSHMIREDTDQILAICTDVDGTRVYYAKWNKSVREDKYHLISLICGV